MRLGLLLCIFLFSSSQAFAAPRWLRRTSDALCGAGAVLAFAEIVLTERCIQRGQCREVNPIMPEGQSAEAALGRAAIKGAGTWGTWRIAHKADGWTRFGVCAGAAASNAFLTHHSLRVQR